MDRLRRFVEPLRVLAQTNDSNRVDIIENAINEYLKAEPGTLRLSLVRTPSIAKRLRTSRRGLEHSEGLCSFAASTEGIIYRPRTREPAESQPERYGLIKSPAIERGLIESDARVQRKSNAKGFLPGCALGPL
jgi:hypothetical protein